MPSPVPTPVAAALGLVPTVLGGVRRLPGKAIHSAVQLPVLAVSSALAGLDLARREYDDLAERGERLLARLRGKDVDELEDVVEDSLQGTPLARPYDAVEDAVDTVREAVSGARSRAGKATSTVARTADKAADKAESAADKAAGRSGRAADDAVDKIAQTTPAQKAAAAVGKAGDAASKAADKAGDAAAKTGDAAETRADKAVGKAGDAASKAADKAGDAASKAADKAGDAVQEPLPDAEQPKGAPTPSATQPDSTRLDTAASTDVVETVEQVADRVPGSPQDPLPHDQLPLPDNDHMTLGSLRGRLRSLTVEQLVQIRDYEQGHADRLPVVTMLDNRIAKLASDAGATPAGAASDRPASGQTSSKGDSKVKPATQGPVQGTAPHGVPGNSQQPR